MSKNIARVLIANRGEVALRITRSLKDMGIVTIAIYTDPDRGAPHTLSADVAIGLGAPQGYLDIPLIVRVAKEAGADAIHPGYGFLSERPEFAAAVVAAGIIFIGPTAEMISSMGSKIGAKVLLKTRVPDVPFVPGYFPMPGEPKPTPADLAEKAKKIRFPLLVKAAAGGGGKGMRVLRGTEDIVSGIESAMTEARNSFGDDAVMLEEYLEGVKHIEIQILGDEHGNVMSLFERECSVQRRHQKLIEEAPSPFVTPALRKAMGDAACAIAKCLNYCNAGTVEFIVDPRDGKFYFLEVNTRLQVEHPVTECVTGIDLVKAQVHVASGKLLADAVRLSMRNGTSATIPPQPVGYAVEVRVYSENDEFQPCTGIVSMWHEEPNIEGMQYHTTVVTGSLVSVFYDGLLTKVIAYATESRDAAFNKIVRALRGLVCLGLQTNKRSLIHLLNHPVVRQGIMCTDFIDRSLDRSTLALPLPYAFTPLHNSHTLDTRTKASYFAAVFLSVVRSQARGPQWRGIPAGFRVARKTPLVQRLDYRGTVLTVSYTALTAATPLPATYLVDNKVQIVLRRLDPVTTTTVFEVLGSQENAAVLYNTVTGQVLVHVGCTGEDYDFLVLEKFDTSTPTTVGPSMGTLSSVDASGGSVVKAPMPAKVLKVLLKSGDTVAKDSVIVVLESMKMESKVVAPVGGTVTVSVKAGDLIPGGKILFTVHAEKKQEEAAK